MEVMDINEQLMELEEGAGKEELESTISALSTTIYAPVENIVENYQEGVTSEKELLQVKEYYYKKKYLDRIQEEIKSRV
jgi:molecular chaperone HscB